MGQLHNSSSPRVDLLDGGGAAGAVDGRRDSDSAPTGLVFDALGVIELEHWMHQKQQQSGEGGEGGDEASPSSSYEDDDGDDDDSEDDIEEGYSSGEYDEERYGNDTHTDGGGYTDDIAQQQQGTTGEKFDSLPTFNSRGRFRDYEHREGDASDNDGHDLPPPPVHPRGVNSTRKKKYYCILFTLLLATVGIIVALFVSGRAMGNNEADGSSSQFGDVSEGSGDNTDGTPKPTRQPSHFQSKFHDYIVEPPASSSSNNNNSAPDLSKYGYEYTLDTTKGWLSWPPIHSDDWYQTFTKEDGVSNVEWCAEKCESLDAPTGAWMVREKACRCTFVEPSNLCKEPCVEEEYISFSSVSFSNYEYCTNSVCSKDWSHNEEYCTDTVQFDQDACDAKIASLASNNNEEFDLSEYGYDYTQDASEGWISWPPVHDTDSFKTYKSTDGITSIEECAAQCQGIGAATGAWSVQYSACWCNKVDTSNLCKEPCVTEEYIDFSTVPFGQFDYCDKSVCDKDWYHSERYCDVAVKFDQDECDAKIEIKSSLSSLGVGDDEDGTNQSGTFEGYPSGTYSAANLSEYGYDYVKYTAVGWISWPHVKNDETFQTFKASDGVSSIDECAAKCKQLSSPTGAWSIEYQACWCNQVETPKLCLEPCVEQEYIDFSTVPFDDFKYCSESVCASSAYHNPMYCTNTVKFDKDECDAKIQALGTEVQASPSIISLPPFVSSSDSATQSDEQDAISLKATAVSTVKKSDPDYKWGGQQELVVERNERVSYIRFDLSSIPSGEDIVKATLKLYSKTHRTDQASTTVDVGVLPHGGNSWSDQSISWNNSPSSKEAYTVASFEAKGLLPNVAKELIEVDVTSAISPDLYDSVTFRLSTESGAGIWFASRNWNGGEAAPELLVQL